jgi:asparagine synthetase B (glutamine-hydrolysing)
VRSPFLDPRFAEFMARVPTRLKVRGRQLRYLQRRLGERYLPDEVLRRKKQGFASPLMYIMDGEVRTLAPRLLKQSELVRDGYLRGERIDELVREHLGKQRDHGNRIRLPLPRSGTGSTSAAGTGKQEAELGRRDSGRAAMVAARRDRRSTRCRRAVLAAGSSSHIAPFQSW